MIVSIKNKAVFVAVEHTGSTSIHDHVKHCIMDSQTIEDVGFSTYSTESWVYDHGDMKHAGLSEIEKFLRNNNYDTSGTWDAFFSFRDPRGYYSSDFYLKHRLAKAGNSWQWTKNQTNSKVKQFQDFAKKYKTLDDYLLSLSLDAWYNHYANLEQRFLRHDEMNFNLHRTDYDKKNYHSFFKSVCEGLGVPAGDNIPHINNSSGERKTKPLKPETRKILECMGM